MRQFYPTGVLVAIFLLFICLATGSALTLRPWCDEGWFSSPALNLVTRGSMGTSVLDPTSSWRRVNLTGINLYTYWIMPLYILAQAGWYEIAGFSLFSMRMLSILWGSVALAAWYIILRSLSRSTGLALLGLILMAIDLQFIWNASAGRMDMMTAALEFSAWASYLSLRERRLNLAILVSQTLIVTAGLTHPAAITAAVSLLFIIGYFDRARLKFAHVGIAAIPYLLGAAGWGLYIARNPPLFVAQFSGNASDRWLFLQSPFTSLMNEITVRYLYTFGFAPYSAGVAHIKIIALIAYVAGVAGALSTPAIRNHRGYRALLGIAAIQCVLLMLIDGFQQQFYLVHTIPVFAALLAVWFHWGWVNRKAPRWLMLVAISCLAATQIAVTAARIRNNPYARDYLAAANYVKSRAGQSNTVMASAEFAFQLGFADRLVDDYRLGYRSGKHADLIVLDEAHYQDWIAHLREQDPRNYEYIERLLANQYDLVYNRGSYKIYARRTAS